MEFSVLTEDVAYGQNGHDADCSTIPGCSRRYQPWPVRASPLYCDLSLTASD